MPEDKSKLGLLSKDGKLGSIVAVIMMIVMALGIAFLGIDNGKKADRILDLEAELKTQQGYSHNIQNLDGFAIAEALRVSGSDKILEAIQKEDPQALIKLQERWKDLQPVTYQKIYIDRPQIDTFLVSKTSIKSDTITVEFDWTNHSLTINGKTYLIPDTITQSYTSFTKLNITQEPLKLIITVTEDGDGNLKTMVLSSDTTIKISEIDTRLAKNFTLKKDIYFLLGGSLGYAFVDKIPRIGLYTGLDFMKNNWSLFLRLDMFEGRVIDGVSAGFMKKF